MTGMLNYLANIEFGLLAVLGKHLLALQAEMRTVRSENASLRMEMATTMANAITTITTTINDRIAQFETLVETRLDQTERIPNESSKSA